jgi:AcrR family transcriptional regulator
METSGDNARARAARTKRARTQAALLTAALEAFQSQGWTKTRMEEIATAAGVSVATAYKHFAGKDVLLARVYAPFVLREQDRSRHRTEAGLATSAALEEHVRDLALMIREQETLALAYTRAVAEYAERVSGPIQDGDELDPRNIAPMADEMTRLISDGQRSGEFRPHPAAREIATMVVGQMLNRVAAYPGENPNQSAEISLTTLFAIVTPQRLVDAGRTGRPFAQAPARAPVQPR